MRVRVIVCIVMLFLVMTVLSGCKKEASPTEPTSPSPVVISVSPSSGPTNGGTVVTITGTGFASGANVTFGGTAATGVAVASSSSITATTPAHSVGAVDLVVTNPDGKSGRLANGFTYEVIFNVSGSWEGSTARGATFKFSVSDMKITWMILSNIPNCSTLYGWTCTCAVSGNAFSYTFPSGNPDLAGQITGTFTSATRCSGNMNVTFKRGCSGSHNCSWTAQKK